MIEDDFNVCECLLHGGEDAVPMSLLGIFEHLQEAHGIDTNEAEARIVLHVNGSTWDQMNIVWSINGTDVARQFNRWSRAGR